MFLALLFRTNQNRHEQQSFKVITVEEMRIMPIEFVEGHYNQKRKIFANGNLSWQDRPDIKCTLITEKGNSRSTTNQVK